MLPPYVTEAIDTAVSQRTGKPLSDHSKKTYKSNLRTLFRNSGSADFDAMVKDVKGTSKAIADNDNIHTRFAQLSALNMLFGRMPRFQTPEYAPVSKKWADIQKEVADLYEKGREENKLTSAQTKKYMEIPDLQKVFRTHYDAFRRERGTRTMSDAQWKLFVKRLLILSLYSLHPPVRQDYGCIRLYKTKKTHDNNHIVLPSHTLVLTEYKTSHTYGRVESKLPVEVIDILKTSLDLEPRQWLFVKGTNKPYTHSTRDTNAFSVLVNRSMAELVGKPIDVTSIRRAYTTWLADQKLTFAERRKVAEIMGHSVIQSMKYQVVQGGGSGGDSGGGSGGGVGNGNGNGSASGDAMVIRVGGEEIGFDQLTDAEVSSILVTEKKDVTDSILAKLTESQKAALRQKLGRR
eukprot:jgi/Tetstr1/447352/TSEL_034789.t1